MQRFTKGEMAKIDRRFREAGFTAFEVTVTPKIQQTEYMKFDDDGGGVTLGTLDPDCIHLDYYALIGDRGEIFDDQERDGRELDEWLDQVLPSLETTGA